MLVLSRREAEEIRIGDNIEIYIIEIRSNRVRFGIRAPRDIPVIRSEISGSQDLAAVHCTTNIEGLEKSTVPILPHHPK